MQKKTLLIFSIVLLCLAVIISFESFTSYEINPDFITFITFFVIQVGLLVLFYKKQQPIPWYISTLVVVGFLIRSLYAYQTYTTVFSVFPDSFNYIRQLNNLLMSNDLSFKNMESTGESSQFFYFYLMYFTAKIFKTTFSQYLVNILLFNVSALLFYRLAEKEFGKKVAKLTTVIGFFSITFLLFTSNILKDSLVLFLSVLIFYLYKNNLKKTFLLVLLLSGCLIMTRIYTGFGVIAAILFDIFINRFKRLSVRITLSATLAGALLILFKFTILSSYLTTSTQYIQDNSLMHGLAKVPRGLLLMFFSPVPWGVFYNPGSIYNIVTIDTCFAMLFCFTILMFFYKIFKFNGLRKQMGLYIIPIIIHAFALGLQYDGGSIRQRIGVYFYIILIFVIGLIYKPEKHKVIV